MAILFLILVVVASVALGFIVLVQNPKGGGLAGNVGGLSNQLMGVKQTTDVLEKGTWLFAAIVGILCIVSPAFIPKGEGSNSKNKDLMDQVKPEAQKAAPVAPQTQMPGTVAPDSLKKP